MKPRKLNCNKCRRTTDRNDFMCLSCGTLIADCIDKPRPKPPRCGKCDSYRTEEMGPDHWQCRECADVFIRFSKRQLTQN
jgi:hypothetical protein